MAKPATCATAVRMVATQHPHRPVREYLDGLEWDGTERLDSWLATCLGAMAEPGREAYLRQIGRKSLIQAVARIAEPGCKADHMPVLRGPQGIGTSSAIRALAVREEWFADEIADLGSKDAAQDLAGKWVIEVPELAAIRGREVERVKAFTSRSTDHYRPSYGRRSQDHPRQCVFFGTTNADTYLQDETGNRRSWPITAGEIDLAALIRDRDQLWAEAVAAYRAGETWWLDREAERAAARVQARHLITDAWEEYVLDYIEAREWVSVAAILTTRLSVPIERQDQKGKNRVVAILKANGWKREHR